MCYIRVTKPGADWSILYSDDDDATQRQVLKCDYNVFTRTSQMSAPDASEINAELSRR